MTFSFLKNLPPEKKLRFLRGYAALILFLEMTCAALWRSGFVVIGFVTLWLWEIPRQFGMAGDALALLLFVGGLIYVLPRDLHALRLPTRRDIDRRLEQDSNLLHRPIIHLTDTPVAPEGENAAGFWARQVAAARLSLSALRRPQLRSVLDRQDPFAFRIVIFMLFAAGIIVAGAKAPARIAYGLLPFSVHWTDQNGDTMALWITPPAFTRLPQTVIKGNGTAGKTITVPEGSIIKARVSGGIGTPYLVMDGKAHKMNRLNKSGWSIETTASPTTRITVRQMFLPRLSVPIAYAADQPPQIALSGDPKTNPPGVLQFFLTLNDDYGARDLVMDMRLDPATEHAPAGDEISEKNALSCEPAVDCPIAPVYDLAAHPWAGLPVQVTFTAIDDSGRKAFTEPITVTLPERTFQNATARQLAMMRKRLIWTPDAAAQNISSELLDIIVRPSRYRGDHIVFLSLRSMISRLEYERMPYAATSIIPQLWDTALRIEDGNVSLASRDLRTARQELEKLLSDPNATQEQIAVAMEKLQAAMQSYMQEMMQNVAQNMADSGLDPEAFSSDMFKDIFSADEMQAFMDQMRAQALSGDRDSARQMLAQMQQMMDAMSGNGSSEPPKEFQDMMEMARDLADILRGQQDLESKTTAGKTSAADLAQEQEKIRQSLGELMAKAGEKLPSIPDGMQGAESEMRGSSGKLGAGQPVQSLPHQQKAIDHLQQQKQQMSQQIAQMLKQMTLMSMGAGSLDPTGRPTGQDGRGFGPGARIKIPDEATRRRAYDILNILRQKSGEYTRPGYERDYFNRLMKQF